MLAKIIVGALVVVVLLLVLFTFNRKSGFQSFQSPYYGLGLYPGDYATGWQPYSFQSTNYGLGLYPYDYAVGYVDDVDDVGEVIVY